MLARAAVLIVAVVAAGCAGRRQPETPAPPTASDRNFVVPALEIAATVLLTNLGGRQLAEPAEFDVTWTSIRRNLSSRWVIDADYFEVNQLVHPYLGAAFHGTARSTGLNYWQSAAYAFAGSALWEIAGETSRPSRNDQIASGIAGSFLGEPLFRTARQLLDGSGGGRVWRGIAATVLSPPAAINGVIFGERFAAGYPPPPSASAARLEIGVTAALVAERLSAAPRGSNGGTLGFMIDHSGDGPGSQAERRPFDRFRLEGSISPRAIDSLFSRGVIAGAGFSTGTSGHGVVGVYGLYDYFAPDVMKVSATAVASGTTMDVHVGPVTLQPTALVGIGYTAVESTDQVGRGPDRYGLTPQALASLRFVAGRHVSVDVTTRGYRLDDVAAGSHTLLVRSDASLTVRITGSHGVGVRYSSSRRDATAPSRAALSRSTLGVFYTLLSGGN